MNMNATQGIETPRRPLRFTTQAWDMAVDEWGFNCGPGALCAVLNLTPDEIRPQLGDFETKRYTNPTLAITVLNNCAARFRQTYRGDVNCGFPDVAHGLVRIQWGGPWTKPGVPIKARYRQTHWVAMRNSNAEVFDVNAMNQGGWINFKLWHDRLMPWLASECVPKWDGHFWPTHVIEVEPPST